MTDQTTTPAEVIARTGWDHGYTTSEQNAADILAALAAAGFRVERVPDDQTVTEAESLIERLRESVEAVPSLFPDGEPEDACDITDAAAWRMERAADLLQRAFLSPQGDET